LTHEKRSYDFITFKKQDLRNFIAVLGGKSKKIDIMGFPGANRPAVVRLKMLKNKLEYIALTRWKLSLG